MIRIIIITLTIIMRHVIINAETYNITLIIIITHVIINTVT